MPEGPEVETVRRSIAPLLVGRTLGAAKVSRHALRTKVTARSFAALSGRRVLDVARHGKALFIDVDGGAGLQVRLGMTGRLLVVPSSTKAPAHTHVRIDVDVGADEMRYVDARRFGEVVPWASAAERAELASGMGPDALLGLDDAGRAVVTRAIQKTERALKDVLLDQTVLAGVGNIYAAEILWRARLSPFRTGASVDDGEAASLLDATRDVLADAVRRRGTSFSDYVDANGERGDNLPYLAVFQREGKPCPACGARVRRAVQGARSTFYCATCQPRQQRRRNLR
jgi:formamidopyrimidine-DNA glycosylase